MLGDFITRALILVLGYAYPAFECYKTVEKNRIEIEELRFWCQYWILVAILTVLERIADVFASWMPMYGEFKLAFFIYLWYPKTKGTDYVYQTLLRPYVSKHETDIDRKILEIRARVWDLAIYYWHNCAELGQEKFFDILRFLAGQSAKYSNHSSQDEKSNQPAPSNSINRSVSEATKPNHVQVHSRSPSEPVIPDEEGYIPGSPTTPNEQLLQARLRLRRQKPHH